MSRVMLIQANALAIPLADKSVHMVCTSPPYWGLRDYHTGTSEGGDATCDHVFRTRPGLPKDPTSTRVGNATNRHERQGWKGGVCGKCGAQRINLQIGAEGLHDCAGAFTGQSCGSCYVCHLRQVAAELWRVLRDDGTLFLNLGDTYYGEGNIGTLKPKDLCGIPWRVALALQADGWTLRSEIIWTKPNAMPESVTDRPTRAHEQVFLFSKNPRYYFDGHAIKEPQVLTSQEDLDKRASSHNRYIETDGDAQGFRGMFGGKNGARYNPLGRNSRTVWTLATEPFAGAHFAAFPQALAKRCILAGSSAHGVCPECQSPYSRVVEYGIPIKQTTRGQQAWARVTGQRDSYAGLPSRSVHTTDWRPTCDCIADTLAHGRRDPGHMAWLTAPRPAVVLDPFCGSGTTLKVARDLGRHGIGMDLSWAYLHEVARERLDLAALQAWEQGGKPGHVIYDDLPLFT